MKAILMKAIQRQARTATGYENGPKWKGPRTNEERLTTRSRMGIA